MINNATEKPAIDKESLCSITNWTASLLQQSMEQIFNRVAPAQSPAPPPEAPASIAPPHIASITLVSALPPAKLEEPSSKDSDVKGSSAIATQSIQALVSQFKVSTSTPLLSLPLNLRLSLLQESLYLFKPWNRRNMELTLWHLPFQPCLGREKPLMF